MNLRRPTLDRIVRNDPPLPPGPEEDPNGPPFDDEGGHGYRPIVPYCARTYVISNYKV